MNHAFDSFAFGYNFKGAAPLAAHVDRLGRVCRWLLCASSC